MKNFERYHFHSTVMDGDRFGVVLVDQLTTRIGGIELHNVNIIVTSLTRFIFSIIIRIPIITTIVLRRRWTVFVLFRTSVSISEKRTYMDYFYKI